MGHKPRAALGVILVWPMLVWPMIVGCGLSGPPASGPASADETPPPPPPTPIDVPPCRDDASEVAAGIAASFESKLAANGVPGGALAIVCGGETILAQGFGLEQTGGAAVDADTRFQLASATKMFTAATALALQEQGVVDLHAPLSTYLPFVSYGDITLHQLLTHTAGFPTDFVTNDPDLATLVSANADMQMWASPGAVWNYSNPGFSVAGFALQEVTGRAFADLVADELLAPAGMQATLDLAQVQSGAYAFGHSDDAWYAGAPIPADGAYYATTYYGPMGGLWGSANDLAAWGQLHVRNGGDALSEESVAALRTPHSATTYGSAYGYGMFVDENFDPPTYSHAGSVVGFLTDFQVIPELGFAVGVVVNADWWFPSEIVEDVSAAFADASWSAPARTEGTAAHALYVGVYDDPVELGTIEIVEDGGGLLARFSADGTEAPLQWWFGDAYESTFRGEWIDLNFWRADDDSAATHLVSLFGVAARVED